MSICQGGCGSRASLWWYHLRWQELKAQLVQKAMDKHTESWDKIISGCHLRYLASESLKLGSLPTIPKVP